MGFKSTITIRHIRGQVFDVEVERDADCLGLKLLVFEAKGIPIERQRLVYAGKEIKDTDVLIALGIEGGSTVYLVETNGDDGAVAATPEAAVAAVAMVTPQPQPQPQPQPSVVIVQQPAPEPVPIMNQGSGGYASMSGDIGPKGEQILALNKSVRRFLWFGLLMACTVGLSLGVFDVLVVGMLAMGLYGTAKMRPLLLWGPIVLTKLLALAAMIGSIVGMVYHFCPFEILLLIVGLLIAVVCACIFKLFVLMNGCNKQQLAALRARQDAMPKCCFRCCW